MFSDEQRRGLIVVVPLLLAVLLLSVLVERRTEPVLLAERGPTRTEADSAAVLRPFDPNRPSTRSCACAACRLRQRQESCAGVVTARYIA